MPYVNNNKFRAYLLTIEKRVNGVVDNSATVVRSLLDAIPNTIHSQITTQTFERMGEAQYLARLSAFYTYVESTYSYFQRSQVPASGAGAANGTDAIACPINIAVIAQQVQFNSQLYLSNGAQGSTDLKSRITYGSEILTINTFGSVVFDNIGQVITITPLISNIFTGVTAQLVIEKNGITIFNQTGFARNQQRVEPLVINDQYTISVRIYKTS